MDICKLFKAKIYLADVDSSNGLMTKKNVLECIKKYNLKKIKALVTMHLGGNAEYTGDFYNNERYGKGVYSNPPKGFYRGKFDDEMGIGKGPLPIEEYVDQLI